MQENLTEGSRVPVSENTDKKCGTTITNIWLSYVIPLYNCGEYISTCLDSVLAQGLKHDEYEVIVVNDGSTDNGGEIVAQYCQKHNNFRLINKENGGVSSARNRGIDEACGEYIYFMDADDYLLPNGMKILRDEYLERYGHADVIKFERRIVDKCNNQIQWESVHPSTKFFQGSLLEYGNRFGIPTIVWINVISLKLIKEHNLYFQHYIQSEDMMYMFSLFNVIDATIIETNLDIYRHYIRQNSAMRRRDCKHVKHVCYNFFDIAKELKKMKETSPYNEWVYCKQIVWCQTEAFYRIYQSSFTYKEMKDLFNKSSQSHFYPIETKATLRIYNIINKLYHYPFIVYLFSLIYRHLYTPFIKPLNIIHHLCIHYLSF